MSDGHGHVLAVAPKAPPRTMVVMAILVGVTTLLTTVGALFVWPKDLSFIGSIPSTFEGYTWQSAVVVGPAAADGTMTAVIDGHDESDVRPLIVQLGLNMAPSIGDHVRALEDEEGNLIFSDFVRGSPMLWLFVAYLVIVVAVARWRGLGALVGLFLALGIVIFFTVPSLIEGNSPLLVGLVTGSGALLFLLYLAHGINARTTTAYLGTIAGLAVTGVLGWWAVAASKLTGAWSDEGTSLLYYLRDASPPGLVLCGVILAGLGVLNDVTVAQASSVWELHDAKPHASRWELFRRAMRIGRDHIASTVYTIAFVYVGAALPTIILASLYDSSVAQTLTSSEIAEEIVRTLVGSIGLVLVVPLTTLIGVLIVTAGDGADADARHPRGASGNVAPEIGAT